jgi:hypothetical protein
MPMEIEKGNTKDADQSDGERGGGWQKKSSWGDINPPRGVYKMDVGQKCLSLNNSYPCVSLSNFVFLGRAVVERGCELSS